MDNFRDYYQLLDVPGDATPELIKQAFRKLARKYHPDVNPGNRAAEENFKQIGEAYEVLSDPEKRAQYDRFGQFWNQAEDFGSARSRRWPDIPKMDFSQFPDFNTFVDDLLGKAPSASAWGAASQDRGDGVGDRPASATAQNSAQNSAQTTSPAKPCDIEAHLAVPLEKAYSGGLERIRLADGRALEIDMPRGLVTGQQIRLRGQGIGGGDLYLQIEISPHPFYQLQEQDLHCHLPVSPAEAMVGATVKVPTLDGPVALTLPPGIQSGRRLRLAGKGYPDDLGERGDQIVEIEVVLPPALSEQARSLYEQLYRIENHSLRQDLPY